MLLLRRNNKYRKIHVAKKTLPENSKNVIFYGPKVGKAGFLSQFLRFFGSFSRPEGRHLPQKLARTAQRLKKGVFEKCVFSGRLAKQLFFCVFFQGVFLAEKGVKKPIKK